jgi:hypothetical protein
MNDAVGRETYRCRWCGEELPVGDRDYSNAHFLNANHTVDYINDLERAGLSELEAHRKVNALVEGIIETVAGH